MPNIYAQLIPVNDAANNAAAYVPRKKNRTAAYTISRASVCFVCFMGANIYITFA